MKKRNNLVHERHEKHEMECKSAKDVFVPFRVFRGQVRFGVNE
jgi:hypothetical protein